MKPTRLYSPSGRPIVGTLDTVPALTLGTAWRNEDGGIEFKPAADVPAELDWHAKEQVYSCNRLGHMDPLYQDDRGFAWHECDLIGETERGIPAAGPAPALDQSLTPDQERLLNSVLAKQITALIHEAIDEGRPATAKFLAIALRELASPSEDREALAAEAA